MRTKIKDTNKLQNKLAKIKEYKNIRRVSKVTKVTGRNLKIDLQITVKRCRTQLDFIWTCNHRTLQFPCKMSINILFGHFPKYCCGRNICQQRVSVISTFSQPAQVVGWSLDFLSPHSLLLVPKYFSSCHFWQASYHAPRTGKLTAKCPLCSTGSPSFSRQPQHFHLNTTPAETMRSRIGGKEIQGFRDDNSSQTNAYSHYSNYS